MASLPVKDEWTKSLAKGTRIILILFEPCKLDPELTGLAWVDFTRPFDKALSKLIGFLARSTQPTPSTLPQKWMHVPASVMGFAFLSVLLTLLCAFYVFLFGMFLLFGIYVPLRPGHFSAANAFFSCSSPIYVLHLLPAIIIFIATQHS